MIRKPAAAFAAAAALLLAPALAHATAVVRVEFVRAVPSGFQWGATANQPYELDAPPQTLTVTGSTQAAAQATGPAPAFGPSGAPVYTGFAHVQALSGAADCAWGVSPQPWSTGGVRVDPGHDRWLAVASGQTVVCIEDAAAPSALPDTSAGDLAAIHSAAASLVSGQTTGNASAATTAANTGQTASNTAATASNTAALAKESGGNLAAAKTDLDAVAGSVSTTATNSTPFKPSGASSSFLGAGTTSSNVPLSVAATQVVVDNRGQNDVEVAFGGSGVSLAWGAGWIVPAGSCRPFTLAASAAYMAAITQTGTSNVTATPGTGTVACGGGGGGSVSGTVVAEGPTPAGNPATTPPQLIGGTQDGSGTGIVQNVQVASNGHLQVDATITSGSVSLAGGLTPVGVTATDASGSITSGGAFQSVMAANTSRKACLIQNPITATETLYVFFGAHGSGSLNNSFALAPGASVSCNQGLTVNTDNIDASAATTGHGYIASYAQ